MHTREAGYTLVELLASLVILGMVSAMMFQGVSAGRRVWERADVADAHGEAISGTQLLLRDRIEQIVPATRYDKVPVYVDFTGISNGVNFLSQPRDIRGVQAIMRYTLALMPNGDLVLSDISDLASDPKAPQEQLVLLHNVQQLDIAYFGLVPPDKEPAWHDQWQGRQTLPLLMRVRVEFPPEDTRAWPDLLIKPFATVDTMCVLTVISGKCRGRQ